jgi:ribosome-binding protein aMBF1 (putative translation factor)
MHHFDQDFEANNLPVVPRQKAERPKPVSEPKLAEGQAERLLRSRETKAWSLRDLAAASGVSVRTILAIESGKAKGATGCNTMARLADALGVPRGWLAFGG